MTKRITLTADDLEPAEGGGHVWPGLSTEDAADIVVEVDLLHVTGSVRTGGSFTSAGAVVVEGALTASGDVACGDYLIVGADLVSGGDVTCGDDLTVGARTTVARGLKVKGELRPGWHLEAKSVEAGVLYWVAMHPPMTPKGALNVGFAWGYEIARDHWSARLGRTLKGDLAQTRRQLAGDFDAILNREGLSETEQWIVGSHARYAALPEAKR